jgi:PST family polysaccharide transporter
MKKPLPPIDSSVPQKSPESSITQKTVRSSAWIFGRGLATNVINLGVMVILARQLTPDDFGLVTLGGVLLRFIASFGAGGVGEYIIYDQQEGREERIHAAFWLNLTLSLGVMVLGWLSLPVISRFYTTPGLTAVMATLIVRYGLDSLSIVPDALIKKTINFQKLVIRDTILEIGTSICSVVLALLGWGVWSLVIPGFFVAPLRFIAVMRMSSWSPSLPLRLSLWRTIFKFSGNIIGWNLATTIMAEGDTLIVGKTLGSKQVGLYNQAFQAANMIYGNVSSVVGRLAMPSLSAVAQDPLRLRNAFHRMLRIVGIISFPLLIGLFVVADLFVLTIYGSQWQASILPLQILLIYAISRSVDAPATVIYNVVGKPELGLKFSLGLIPFYILSIWIGSSWGIVGVAIGVTVTRVLGGLVAVGIAAHLLKETTGELLWQLWHPLSAALLMGGAVWLGRQAFFAFNLPMLFELGLLIVLGGIIYFGLLLTVYRSLITELLSVVDALYRPLGLLIRKIIPCLASKE